MVKVLTKLRIDEVSAVDRAAGKNTKIVLMKRDDQNFRSVATSAIYPRAGRSFLEVLDDMVDDVEDDEYARDDRDDDDDDLSKKDTPMDPIEIMKRHPVAFCTVVAEDGDAHGVGEHELVAALSKYAGEQHPEMSADKAFAELYKNADVWRACAIAKAASFTVPAPYLDLEPQVVGGADARDVNDPAAALAAIKQLTEIGRLKWPGISDEQAFSRAFSDPKNAALAAKAHRRPAATSIFPHPLRG